MDNFYVLGGEFFMPDFKLPDFAATVLFKLFFDSSQTFGPIKVCVYLGIKSVGIADNFFLNGFGS